MRCSCTLNTFVEFLMQYPAFRLASELLSVPSLFKPRKTHLKKIRVGGDGDGGYILPDCLDQISFCMSIGVGASNSFELDLAAVGISCVSFDEEIPPKFVDDARLHGVRTFVGASKGEFSVNDGWNATREIIGNVDRGILQLDAEGFEWQILNSMTTGLRSKLPIIVIEFHDFHLIASEVFRLSVAPVMQTLNDEYFCFHASVNEVGGLHRLGEIYLPGLLEVTFIRRDFAPDLGGLQEVEFDSRLDRPNRAGNAMMSLPLGFFDD